MCFLMVKLRTLVEGYVCEKMNTKNKKKLKGGSCCLATAMSPLRHLSIPDMERSGI